MRTLIVGRNLRNTTPARWKNVTRKFITARYKMSLQTLLSSLQNSLQNAVIARWMESRGLKYTFILKIPSYNTLLPWLTLNIIFYFKTQLTWRHSMHEAERCSDLVLIFTMVEMRENPLNITPTAVFIWARRPQKPNRHYFAQNTPENQIYGNSGTLCEN